MFDSTSISLAILATGVLAAALTSGNGASEPVGQAIAVLQNGNTAERRQAAEVLARLGEPRAIPPLARALRDPDQLVRAMAEQALWSIWHHSGKAEVDARLQDGIIEMQRGALERAVAIFTEVIELAPDFAEGYNKRATTYYMMQEYEQSIRDCEKTIALNPIHFGALSGTGLNYLGLREPRKALEYFERALEANPNMPQIQAYIEAIRKFLRDQSL
ncbi:MAG TPA: tetratricopeptide repeat protein [Candidatus Tectomicrobia bacterium]|jgi:tetratricopeptide (TPR) repeat protein